ncbi:MAG: hypothetical protein KAW12_07185 [Candidatus Aminicenantes bacterium]|nr:hypothetical protein [Candidatus Aminicenantes bacterium]
MFLGAIPPVIGQYIRDEIARHHPKRVIIPFSGNFSIEQIAHAACPQADVHSTDIIFYSRAIGFGVNDIDFRCEIKPEFEKDFSFLAGKVKPIEKAAVVVMFLCIADAFVKKNKIYYLRLYQNLVKNQEVYYQKILQKLEQLKSSSDFTFYGTCASKLIEKVGDGDLVIFDPPYFVDGYVNMFKNLPECLNFDEVDFLEITDEVKAQQLEELSERGALVYYRTISDSILTDQYRLVYYYQYKYNLAYLIYSTSAKSEFVGRKQLIKEKVQNIHLIGRGDEISENGEVDIVKTETPVVNHYRLMWLKKSRMRDGRYSFLVFIDKKLIGILMLQGGLNFGTDLVTIFADTSAPSSRYKRLSKLILYLCSTEKMLNTINDLTMWPHSGFTTRVTSNSPVSMKYRGIFKLAKREKDSDSEFKYKLIYQNRDRIFPDYKIALKEWVRKHGRYII